MKNVGFFLWERVHGRKDTASSRLRGHWLIKYWPEAEEYRYGQKYDAIIFNKTFLPDFMRYYKGIKIFDICDPDHLAGAPGAPIKEVSELVDAFTCPTEVFKTFLENITDKPIYVIPDRQDLEFFKERKIHRSKAREVVWYGYTHNAHVLNQALPALERLGLDLSIISEKSQSLVMMPNKSGNKYRIQERWTKWELASVNKEIIKSDIVLMPSSLRVNDKYKSNNKITNAWALGMPVVKDIGELKRFLEPEARIKEAERGLKEVKEHYDIKQSVEEFKKVIKDIKEKRENNPISG